MNAKVALRYSKALLLLKGTPQQQEKRVAELNQVVEFLNEQPQVNSLFVSPQVKKQDKEKLLMECFKGRLEPILMNFLLFLSDQGRFDELPLIVKQFHKKVKKILGIREATLITAVPVDESIISQFKDKLELSYHQKVEISTKIDPSIIGGSILVIGNQMIDFSIKERLARLKEDLLAVPVGKE